METQNTTNTKAPQKPKFERKARLGVNPLTLDEKQTRYFEIASDKVEQFERKNDDPIDFVMATDLESGEEGHLWLSGQLRYQLVEIVKTRKTLKGFKMEVTNKGKSEVEIEIEGKMKKTMVNQYDMYELN